MLCYFIIVTRTDSTETFVRFRSEDALAIVEYEQTSDRFVTLELVIREMPRAIERELQDSIRESLERQPTHSQRNGHSKPLTFQSSLAAALNGIDALQGSAARCR